MTKVWHEPGKWIMNPVNFTEAVTEDFDAPKEAFVLDSTIRKMTGTPGCPYSAEGAVEICRMADAIGVKYVEVNLVHGPLPANEKLLGMFEAIAREDFDFTLVGTAWARDKSTIDDAINAGADGVCIGVGPLTSSDISEGLEALAYARDKGMKVATGLGGRIENMFPEAIAERVNEISDQQLMYVGIHENTGATSPEAWRYIMQASRGLMTEEARAIPIVPHIHDMLGQATMAACAAVTGGAGGVDVAMNGIAIHCGLAALEEVVMCLEMLYGIDTNIDLSLLNEYSRVVSEHTEIPVHPNKPIVGEHAFICELEPFVKAVLEAREQGTERVHPFAPSLVGGRNVIAWGENTQLGPATEVKLRQMGLPHDEESVNRVIDAIKADLSERDGYPLYLTEEEVEELSREILG